MAENGGSETHPTSPLLGTSDPKNIGNTRKSSLGRSPKSVCYTGLLHNRDQGSSPIRRKTTENSHAGCYLAFHARWEMSMSLKVRLATASFSVPTRWPLP
jgi:hypothetical protein